MESGLMDCETLVRYLSAYLDGELSAPLNEAARQHLATCPNCRIVLDSTRQTILLSRQELLGSSLPLARRQALYSQLVALLQGKSS
jgi:anti-sigma factor RsiW